MAVIDTNRKTVGDLLRVIHSVIINIRSPESAAKNGSEEHNVPSGTADLPSMEIFTMMFHYRCN